MPASVKSCATLGNAERLSRTNLVNAAMIVLLAYSMVLVLTILFAPEVQLPPATLHLCPLQIKSEKGNG